MNAIVRMARRKRQSGYALATVLVLLGVALFGVGAIVTITTLEAKISRSHQEGVRAYYVSEAGIQDALWRIENTPAYKSALGAGTLNATYTANDVPSAGQGFTITLQSTSPGYAEVGVQGYSDNGSFRSRRRVALDVFQGETASTGTENAFMTGGALVVTGSNAQLQLTGGNLYASGSVTFTNANVNLSNRKLLVGGSYVRTGGNVNNVQEIRASNYPPAPPAQNIPGFDFNYYAANSDNTYTMPQFQALFTGKSSVTLPGPVTYINGTLTVGRWAQNKNLTVNGMLVINGSVVVDSRADNFAITVNGIANNRSGIFVKDSMTINKGVWNVTGAMYASGAIVITNSQPITVNGALMAGGSTTINPGSQMNLNYRDEIIGAVFSEGEPGPVEVSHWEEEY